MWVADRLFLLSYPCQIRNSMNKIKELCWEHVFTEVNQILDSLAKVCHSLYLNCNISFLPYYSFRNANTKM